MIDQQTKLLIDRRWIGQIGLTLDRFKWTDALSTKANARCPICGDSKSSQTKARLGFFVYNQTYIFKCQKCGEKGQIRKFIQLARPYMLKEYKLELFKAGAVGDSSADEAGKNTSSFLIPKEKEASAPIIEKTAIDAAPWVPISEAPHFVRDYLSSERKLPHSAIERMMYTPRFSDLVHHFSKIPRHKTNLPPDPRIVLPFYRIDGTSVYGIQGRTIGATETKFPRYMTLKFDEKHPKVFGLDQLNIRRPIILVEGPIDSLFLPNAVAVAGGDTDGVVKYLCDVLGAEPKNILVALDNEPRSVDTVRRMTNAIDMGCRVVIWKGVPPNLKDINNMVISGMTIRDILGIIKNNSYESAPRAKLELALWRKTTPTTKQRRRK